MPKLKHQKPLQRSSLARAQLATTSKKSAESNGKAKAQKLDHTGTIQNIKKIETEVASSLKNVNGLTDLMERHIHALQEQDARLDPVLHAVTLSLKRLFIKWHDLGLLKRHASSDPQAQVANWLRDAYVEFWNQLLDMLKHREAAIQLTALKTLFEFMVKDAAIGMDTTNLLRIVQALLHENLNASSVRAEGYSQIAAENFDITVTQFVDEYVNKYDDVLFSTYKVLTKLCHNLSRLPGQDRRHIHATVENVYALLSKMRAPPARLDNVDAEEEEVFDHEAKLLMVQEPVSIRTLRTAFTSCWTTFLTRLPLSRNIYRSTLTTMHKTLMPKLTKPEMILDFLIQAYDSVDDASSEEDVDIKIPILGLSSLFYLIQARNLDYPDFYQKLYALLKFPQVYTSRYRSRLFRLVDTFLSSTHLAATMVAGFVKRLSRMSLSAPPPALLFLIPLVFNLIKRHPTCIVMVHRGDETPELRGFQTPDQGQGHYQTDPYNHDEVNPQACNALESSIWELRSLVLHVNPQVSRLARVFEGKMNQPEFLLEDVLDESWASMFEGEVKAARRRYGLGVATNKEPATVPLEPVGRVHLFPGLKDGDGAWKLWSL